MDDRCGLPAPLTPPQADLRRYPWIKFDLTAFFNSDFNATPDALAWRAGVNLMLRSWWQVPAGSLPDDDVVLRALSGHDKTARNWKFIKPLAVAEFVRCNDGRLYHPMVCRAVNEAIGRVGFERDRKRVQRDRKRDDAKSLIRLVGGTDIAPVCPGDTVPVANGCPRDSVSIANGCPRDEVSVPNECPRDNVPPPDQCPTFVPPESTGKEEGKVPPSPSSLSVGFPTTPSSRRAGSPVPRPGIRGMAMHHGKPELPQANPDAVLIRRCVMQRADGKRIVCGYVDLDGFERQAMAAAQFDPAKSPATTAVLVRWIAEGITPETILAGIRRWWTRRQRDRVPQSLHDFDSAVRWQHAHDPIQQPGKGFTPPLA